MKKIDFQAAYKGAQGQLIHWQYSDKLHPTRYFDKKLGVGFLARAGVSSGQVCYAVTYIKSAKDQVLEFQLTADWYANAFINGTIIRSQRAKHLVNDTGSYFNGFRSPMAYIKLKKGINELLIKVQGGTSSNCFSVHIENPGDLTMAHKPAFLK